jgi:arabinogalactan oligomer/maltooligosaccharide transport system substrate-binding protein
LSLKTRPGSAIFAVFLGFYILFAHEAVSSFDLWINGAKQALPDQKKLQALLYDIPHGTGVIKGISLSELLPPLTQAWFFQCNGKENSLEWNDEAIADRLVNAYLVKTHNEGWSLLAGKTFIESIRSIEIKADIAQEKDLEVWVSWEGVAELKREIERWASLAGVKVRTVDVPDTRTKLLAVARGGGRVPDLIMLQSDNVYDLATAKLLQNLDRIDTPYLDKKGKSAFSMDGRLWALPFYFDTQLVFYNKKKIPKPIDRRWTTDDLEALAGSLHTPGNPSMSWNLYSAYWLLPFALGFGKPSIVDEDGTVRPDDPGTAAALAWMMDLIRKGLLEPLERDAMVARFAAGSLPIILSGSYSIPEFRKIGLDFGVAPYPRVSSTGLPVSPLLDYKGFAMTRASKAPVSSRRLLEYLHGIGVQQRFTAALAKLPANAFAWEMARAGNPYFAVLSQSAEIGSVIPPGKGYSIYKNMMWKIIRFVLSGSMNVPTALKEARRLIDANM